jgi:hypothetical protein
MGIPDLNKPWPDLGHEAIRQVIVQHIDQLADHVQQLADGFLMMDTAAVALGVALDNIVQLQAQVAEPPPAPPPTPQGA